MGWEAERMARERGAKNEMMPSCWSPVLAAGDAGRANRDVCATE